MTVSSNIEKPKLAFAELVALTAGVMALNAFAIDMMLPALGTIGDELGAANDNDRQLVIVVYVIANGVAQLFFGPVADKFGRRRVLLWALGGYAAGCILSIFAGTFGLLLAARGFQGISTAAARVASIALVRDLTSGRRMAEVMSLAVTVFMAAPILAPSFGQAVLFAAPWRGIFVALLAYGLIILAWVFFRLPETQAPENRDPLNIRQVASAYAKFLTNRISLGYTLASALCFGGLFGYISSSEQIFVETFNLGVLFPLAFGLSAASLGAASLLNARIVQRFGMRRIAHCALLGFVIINTFHLATAAATGENVAVFLGFMMASFFCIGLIGANATALALEPMGKIAGAAAGANGFAGTTGAGVIGGIVGYNYDGSTMPIVLAFCLLGAAAFLLVLWTEKGILFRPHHDDAEITD
jgi:DHA1 family bicyclomycin/chloramphenicol resistance-like MFS transporter